MIYLNIKEIQIRKGEEGHPFKVVAIFENDGEWTIRMPELEKICEAIGICEDKKYGKDKGNINEFNDNVLGRNFFLLAHLKDIYEDYLKSNGFNPPEKDIKTAKKISTDLKIEDLTDEI